MKPLRRLASIPVLASTLLLSGCSYFLPTKRHLPIPKTPEIVQTISSEDLVKQLNARWDAFKTLTVTAEITAHDKTKDYPSFRCNIVMQKPKMLRVLGRYFGVTAFDMASDGNHFTLVIPSKNLAIKGSNTSTDKSATEWENLRPDFFFDAIVVRGLDTDDEYMVSSDTETVADAANKHLYAEPEYTLTVVRRKTGREIQPVRTVTFHRDDMLPYDQYIYDNDGALATQIFYSNYTTYSAGKYPSKVIIKRPREGIELDLAVEQVHEPTDLPAGEFDVEIPKDATLRTLN
jgi:outer membrane lipoprotein-sorting protein